MTCLLLYSMIMINNLGERGMQVTLKDAGIKIRDGTQRIRDDQGYLVVKDNPVAVAGVFPFLRSQVDSSSTTESGGEVVYVFRSPESLVAAADMFRNKPIVHHHKWVGKGGERPDADGTIGSHVYYKDGALYSDLIIYNPSLIDEIESGACKQLSPGYNALVTPCHGTYDGCPYEYSIQYTGVNHLGVVENGRAGKQLSIKDKQDTLMDSKNNASIFTGITKGTSVVDTAASEVDSVATNQKTPHPQGCYQKERNPRAPSQKTQHRAAGLDKNQQLLDRAQGRLAAGQLSIDDFNFIYQKLSDENKQIISKLRALESQATEAKKQQDAAAQQQQFLDALQTINDKLPSFKAYGERRPSVLFARAYQVYTGKRLGDGLDSRTAFLEATKAPRVVVTKGNKAPQGVGAGLQALHEWHVAKRNNIVRGQ